MAVGAAAQNEMDYAALGAKGDAANTTNTIIKGLAKTGVTANFNDEQRKRYDEIVKLSRTDPVKAAEEAKAFVNSDAVTSAQREMPCSPVISTSGSTIGTMPASWQAAA